MGPFKLYRGYQAFRAAPDRETAVMVAGQIVGVLGVDHFIDEMAQHALTLMSGSYDVDHAAAEAMVERMRSRVPRDTGRLYNGISYTIDGSEFTVQASAVNPRGRGRGSREGADYARFVEFGTQPRRQAVDASFFDDTSGAGRSPRRRLGRGHPGTPARPFFYNSAREVLAERRKQLSEIIDQVAR
jgi:HK97 gp10 family phage protein